MSLSAVSLWLFGNKKSAPSQVTEQTTTQTTDTSSPPDTTENTTQAPVTEKPSPERTTLTVLASTFAEAYGSYSNQSHEYYLTSLYPFMTDAMKKWAQGQEGELKKTLGDKAIYHGFSTKVVSDTQFELPSATTSSITFKTLRTESIATRTNTKTYYQDINVKMEKVGDTWKVAGAFWVPVVTQ